MIPKRNHPESGYVPRERELRAGRLRSQNTHLNQERSFIYLLRISFRLGIRPSLRKLVCEPRVRRPLDLFDSGGSCQVVTKEKSMMTAAEDDWRLKYEVQSPTFICASISPLFSFNVFYWTSWKSWQFEGIDIEWMEGSVWCSKGGYYRHGGAFEWELPRSDKRGIDGLESVVLNKSSAWLRVL